MKYKTLRTRLVLVFLSEFLYSECFFLLASLSSAPSRSLSCSRRACSFAYSVNASNTTIWESIGNQFNVRSFRVILRFQIGMKMARTRSIVCVKNL